MYDLQKLLKSRTLHLIGGVFCATTIGFAYISSSSALIQSWDEGVPTVKKIGDSSEYSGPDCQWTTGKTIVNHATSTRDLCVFEGKNIRFARGNANEGDNYISIGRDQYFYRFSTNGNRALLITDTDTLVVRTNLNYAPVGVMVYHDLAKKIEFDQLSGTYSLNMNSANLVLKDDDNGQMGVESVSFSENGEWMTGFSARRGIIRLNLHTGDKKLIVPASSFPSNAVMYQDVSNDGQYIATASTRNHDRVYHVDDSCGTESMTTSMPEQDACGYITIPGLPESNMENWSFYPAYIEFQNDDQQLNAVYWSNTTQKYTSYKISQSGYVETPLDYLALGDSYSSGEGDTELAKNGQKYYLAHTDQEENISLGIPKEKCHQSTRAYPFLLADYYNISVGDKFQTVACSGAAMNDISSIGIYNGQGGRLKGISNASSLQAQALDEFIPGRVRQLKFIERYQPKAVTISIGGNDVDFGGKLGTCVLFPNFTCDTASEAGRRKLGNDIKKQYRGLLSLYESIKRVSPSTKIYAVGYPQIILDRNDVQCPLNTGGLDTEERKVMVAGYWYINQVVKTAAKKAGVKYLDTSNALNGHRLCESDKAYANGVVLWGGEKEESFHPNAKGNAAMADEIKSIMGAQGLLDDDSYPTSGDDSISEDDIPDSDYLMTSSSSSGDNVENIDMTDSIVKKQNVSQISLDSFSFKPMSAVSVVLHSDPIQLGTYSADSEGSLSTEIFLGADIPAGYHTLIVSGESYSGESIQYEQSILVEGPDSADVDENGIPDNAQKCGAFMYVSGIDADYDGIDDACDPEIEDTQPYRVRNGNTAKGEKSDYMYIERNIHAADYTGVSGDLDPDGDGWAIVAQSTNAKNAGSPAHFWIDDSKIPHVSIRTDTRGCVQYTPHSLTVVKNNKIRELKQESKNTSTCRKESLGVDVDKDGTPDNQQQLYRARHGTVQAGEDPNVIYLERNSTAAEAQLGISDYSHGRPWNTLASYHGAYPVQFVKLVMDSDKMSIPTVIAKQTKTNPKGKVITTCIALQPKNTNVITIKNQDRKLSKVSLPEGVGCEQK